MHYLLDSEQIRHFEKYGFVSLKEVFSSLQVEDLLRQIAGQIDRGAAFYGRDFARHIAGVRKILFSRSLGRIASELCQKKKLRYATDWCWQGRPFPWDGEQADTSLVSHICVRPLAIGCVIALTDSTAEAEVKEGSCMLPLKKGDILFLKPDTSFSWILKDRSQKFLLFVYGENPVLYVLNPLDPHTHVLKECGYVFGDRLKETTHPLLFR